MTVKAYGAHAPCSDSFADRQAWSAVGSTSMCVALPIASEFMPVSLLTPIAADLHASDGILVITWRELNMNITKIIAATALFAVSISAFSQTSFPTQKPVVSRTRADVIAEIAQAGGNLGRKNYEATFNPSPANASTTSRAEVVVELNQSRGDAARNNYRDTLSH